MQAPSFTISSNLIAQSSSGGQRIKTSGAYTGTIKVAKHVVSSGKGTHGIEFSFESPEGKADYMTLWVMQANGDIIQGFKGIADSIAACMQQRGYTPAVATISEYDFESRQEVQVQATVYPELMNKPVGLILQAEEYQKNNGEIATRMNIVGAFNAETKQTAIEVLKKQEATKLDEIVANLKDKKLPVSQQARPTSAGGANGAESTFEDFDDDIPF